MTAGKTACRGGGMVNAEPEEHKRCGPDGVLLDVRELRQDMLQVRILFPAIVLLSVGEDLKQKPSGTTERRVGRLLRAVMKAR